MTDDEFHLALFEANSKLINIYYETSQEKTITRAKKLYMEKDATFRGFRHG